jgi:hypothetical protein
MPSSELLARVGLLAAVSVVVGISTLGTLTRQPPADTRLITMAPRPPEPPVPVAVVPAVVQPQPTEAATTVNATPAVGAPAVVVPASTTPAQAADATGGPMGGPFVPVTGNAPSVDAVAPVKVAVPAESAAPATATATPATGTPAAAMAAAPANGSFPEIQPLDDPGIVAAPVEPAKPKHKKRVAKPRPQVARPKPFEIREFFAGRW